MKSTRFINGLFKKFRDVDFNNISSNYEKQDFCLRIYLTTTGLILLEGKESAQLKSH